MLKVFVYSYYTCKSLLRTTVHWVALNATVCCTVHGRTKAPVGIAVNQLSRAKHQHRRLYMRCVGSVTQCCRCCCATKATRSNIAWMYYSSAVADGRWTCNTALL